MKRWISEDKFGWVIVCIALFMLIAQIIRAGLRYLWG